MKKWHELSGDELFKGIKEQFRTSDKWTKVLTEIVELWSSISPPQASTSLCLKKQMIDFFEDKNLETVLEVSGGFGVTTRVLSYLFKTVTSVELPARWDETAGVAMVKNQDRDNIIYKKHNVYREEWDYPPQDCIFIDCNHQYDCVRQDLENSLPFLKPEGFLMIHDYSLDCTPWREEKPYKYDVRTAVHEFVNEGKLVVIHYLGHKVGIENAEGVICMKGEKCHQSKNSKIKTN